ncbi:MAG: glycosyltransferase family 39 protein [Chloroflexales bacterium]
MATEATRQAPARFWHYSRTLPRLFTTVSVALTGLALGAYLYVALSRLSFPFALEWVEPASYSSVERVLQGQPLYAPPSYEFIALIYTPLYFYLSAAVTWLSHDVVLATRLVSLVASLAIFGLLYSLARVREYSRTAATLAVGLFALTYHVSGDWFDISRVDSLFLALLLVGYRLAFGNLRPAWLGGACAGLAITLAFMTKQQGALAAPFLVSYLLIRRDWSRAVGFGVSVSVSTASLLLVMNVSSGGWFWMYTFVIPGSHPLLPQLQTAFWFVHIGPQFYPLLVSLVGSLLLLVSTRAWTHVQERLLLIGVFGVPLVLMSYLSMAKQGGFQNGLMPFSAALALIAVDHLRAVLPSNQRPTLGHPLALGANWLVALLILLQFPLLRYDPTSAIPSAGNRAAGERLVAHLRTLQGPLYSTTAPYLLEMVGQPGRFHPAALGDINLATQMQPALKAQLAPYQAAVMEPLTNVRGALLPEVSWYDQIFTLQRGYHCARLPADEQLRTINGAPTTFVTICTRAP